MHRLGFLQLALDADTAHTRHAQSMGSLPVVVVLVVAVIAAAAAIVGAFRQAHAVRRTATINARQEAERHEIALYDRLIDALAKCGQTANVYALRLDREVMVDWDRREPLIMPVLDAHGAAFGLAHSLPEDGLARGPALDALKVVNALISLGDARVISEEWRRDSPKIGLALAAGGRERAHHLSLLKVAAEGDDVRQALDKAHDDARNAPKPVSGLPREKLKG